MNPPDDQDLWAKICAMPRPSKVVDFPRKGPDGKPIGQIEMWVLTQEEQSAAAAAAQTMTQKLVRDAPKHDEARQGYTDVYNNVAAAELLYRACRKVGQLSVPAFPSVAALREKFSVDEVGVLVSNYYSVQALLGPIVADMGQEEVDAWVDRLAVSGEARFPLDSLSPGSLKTLAISLASRLLFLRTANSSPGVPQEGQPNASATSAASAADG